MDFSTTSLGVRIWIAFLLVTTLAYNFWRLFVILWLKPLRAKRFFEAQGLNGKPYGLFYGNTPELVALEDRVRRSPMPKVSHDIAPRMLPHYYLWAQKFGNPFFFWFGPEPRVFVPEPEHAREILSNKFGHYRKPNRRPDTNDLIGKGLVFLEGEKWAQHRRIVSPAFFMEKLKAMIPAVASCTVSMLNDWEAQVAKEASGRVEIDVHVEFRKLTADIISRTAFGSSYAQGKQVFQIQHEQQILFNKVVRHVYVPGSRFVPTRMNRYRWSLENQIQKLLRQTIYKRMEAIEQGRVNSYGDDLLGVMMAANKKELQGSQKNLSMDIAEMVDECKTFYFAGHETTSTLLTWTLLLLGTSTEWQERAREEVVRVCGKLEAPTAESLNNLKTVGMVLNEALRLYPPVVALQRRVNHEMRLGKELILPEGAVALVPVIAFHHDPKYWGPDADLFNPQRFSEGIARAGNNPAAFMPFGLGPRICVGQNFALLEAKVALALILQRFAFHLSPAYSHAPHTVLTLQPRFGMQIIFEPLSVEA